MASSPPSAAEMGEEPSCVRNAAAGKLWVTKPAGNGSEQEANGGLAVVKNLPTPVFRKGSRERTSSEIEVCRGVRANAQSQLAWRVPQSAELREENHRRRGIAVRNL